MISSLSSFSRLVFNEFATIAVLKFSNDLLSYTSGYTPGFVTFFAFLSAVRKKPGEVPVTH